mmetsp:Transcript_925/g.1495  ORF Transcript_925/g.1495 Transcript_925/m.1495 type:complete len:86 (+) Transcript_925:57-314(+)
MCYKVNCKDCKQYTWSGCGRHIKSALSGVEESDRCINWKLGSKSPCGQKTGASAGRSEAAKAPLAKPEPAVVAAGGKSGLFCCFT